MTIYPNTDSVSFVQENQKILEGIVSSACNARQIPTLSSGQGTPVKPRVPQEIFTILTRPLPASPSQVVYQKKKPDWWDAVHRLLEKMALENQDAPVSKLHMDEVYQTARTLIQKENLVELILFLKLLSEFVFYGAKGIFFEVLTRLRTLKPEIEPFFNDIEVDECDEGPILSPTGMNRMFQFFEEEYRFPLGFLSCQPLSALPDLVEEIIASDANHMRGWAISNDLVDIKEDPHVIPMFVLSMQGKVHIFIYDSLGHTISKDPKEKKISRSLEHLIRHFQDKKWLHERLAIYSYNSKRQNGPLDCVTFTLLDLKNLLERHLEGPGNIIDFYASQEPAHKPKLIITDLEEDTGLPVYELDILPPEMMKVTQSLTKIRDYQQHSPVLKDADIPFFERYSPLGDTHRVAQDLISFRKSVSSFERVSPRGKIDNLYVEQKRLEFIVQLLSLHFKDTLGAALTSSRVSRFSSCPLVNNTDQSPSKISPNPDSVFNTVSKIPPFKDAKT
ncbi:MAG: hypothetical protein KGZ39_00875 [Simkania sp.]|nr:hypothetical protein [Simkania sp.]